MAARYVASGKTISLVFPDGEARAAAVCDEAEKAAALLNRGIVLNDKRQYTAAARAIATAEALPGFTWLDQEYT